MQSASHQADNLASNQKIPAQAHAWQFFTACKARSIVQAWRPTMARPHDPILRRTCRSASQKRLKQTTHSVHLPLAKLER